MNITDDLDELFSEEMVVTPVTRDGFGKTTSGVPFVVKVHIQDKQVVGTVGGQTVNSSLQAIVKGSHGLTVEHRYTLPAGFNPRSPKAQAVGRRRDENGAHHETVFF